MAHSRPPVPSLPPVLPPAPPTEQVIPPAQSGQVLQLSCLHFKPEYEGKPDEDAEAHLLRTNDWMDTHAF